MKMFSKTMTFAFMIVFILGTVTEKAYAQSQPTFHAIIVTQNIVSIGSARDRVRVPAEVSTIARMTGMRASIKKFDRNDRGIGAYINSLTVGSDDVLMFYYSGHGSNAGSSVWPMFSNSEFTFKEDKVYKTLKRKNARLTLVLFDCCNHRTGRVDAANRVDVPISASAYTFLFRKSKGSVMVSSSKAGEFSYGSPTVGGYFTDGFFSAIGQIPYQTAAQQRNIWRALSTKTVTNTHSLCSNAPRRQTPQFKLEITGMDNSGTNPVCAPDDDQTGAKDFGESEK